MICAYAEQTLKKLFAKYWISVVSKKEKTKPKKTEKTLYIQQNQNIIIAFSRLPNAVFLILFVQLFLGVGTCEIYLKSHLKPISLISILFVNTAIVI